MKKFLFTAVSAAFLSAGVAQTPFFTKTCYRGAFAPAPAAMWTAGWCNWDPQNTQYPAPTMTVTGNITSNTTWATGQTVLLSAQCYVTNNSILTIQPGVTILGDKAVTGAGLFITKGSQLMANGTVGQPIVFTSNQPVGGRAQGDWGGIILLGKADNNTPGGINYVEGLPNSSLTEFGVSSNPDNNDNSGSLSYIRVEFGGYVYQPDKEINGFTFGAVGRGTNLDHLQVSFCNDDGFEWFGGTVNAKYLVSFRNLDDDFDTDFGFSGNVQFGVAMRDPQIADNPNVSTSEFFESDNNATGTTATPVTSGIFSNMTCIGPLRGSTSNTVVSGHRDRVRIRRNSALKIFNSVFTDQATRGLFIDGSASETNAANGLLQFKNNVLAGYKQRATESGTFGIIGTNTFVASSAAGNSNDTLTSSAGIFIDPYTSFTNPDLRPTATSILLSNVSFTTSTIAAVTIQTIAPAMATIPSSACIGSGTNITLPAVFVPNTSLPEFCALSWSVSPGVSISSTAAINPTFTISTIGTFSTYLTLTTANGNTTVVSAITTATCSDVSVREAGSTIGALSLYPNPSASDVTTLKIDANNSSNITVTVYDITGKLVAAPVQNQNISAGENKISINTAGFNNGIYFVTLSSSYGKETVKLVVNK